MFRKEDVGLIEKHVEKIVLGVAAIILIVAGVHWGLSSPRRIKLEINAGGIRMPQKEYSPDEVDAALETASEKLETLLERKRADIKPLDEGYYAGILEKVFDNPFDDQHVHSYVNFGEGRRPPERKEKIGETFELVKLADLLPLHKPETPLVKACREVQAVLVPDGEVEYKEVDIAHGAAVFEYGKMLKKWKEALEKTYVSAHLVFVAVETQRRYQLPDGSWSQPEPVSMVVMPGAPTLPVIPEPDEKNLLEIQQKANELAWISNQENVLEPPYYDIVWPNRQTGTWQIRNHKPRTRVSDLLEQEDEKPEGAERGIDSSAERIAAEKRAAEKRAADKRAADKRAAEKLGAQKRAAQKRAAELRRRSAGAEGGRGGSEGGRGGSEGGRGTRRMDTRKIETRGMEGGAMEGGAMDRSPRGGRTGRGPVEIDAPALVSIPTLQEQLDNPAGILEIWFHDASLTEGMTYSYSSRLVLLNPLMGRFKGVVDKKDAEVQTLNTPWSDWSEPVKVKHPTEFFLVGSASQMGTVEVVVFTQRWGQRVSHRFTVGPGEPIGGDMHKDLLRLDGGERTSTPVSFRTDAIAVSFNFEKKQRVPGTDFFRTTTTELLYLDASGKLRTRTRFADKSSPRYEELLNEVRQATGDVAGVR